ncbi:MAG: hypothetical protein NT076_03890 [Candidatus Pacearchaeota archaeon]|nr:hypothetical protein [Candidatus Pacearchaeota archaeon]
MLVEHSKEFAQTGCHGSGNFRLRSWEIVNFLGEFEDEPLSQREITQKLVSLGLSRDEIQAGREFKLLAGNGIEIGKYWSYSRRRVLRLTPQDGASQLYNAHIYLFEEPEVGF